MNITEDYVSFEVAKLLKDKGFDGDTSCYYTLDNEKRWVYQHYHDFDKKDRIECPTIQKAIEWLREVHHIHVDSIRQGNYNDFSENYTWIVARDGIIYRNKSVSEKLSYEQAANSAIKYVLENLI